MSIEDLEERIDQIANSGLMRATEAYSPDDVVALALGIVEQKLMAEDEIDFLSKIVQAKLAGTRRRPLGLPVSYADCDTGEEITDRKGWDAEIRDLVDGFAEDYPRPIRINVRARHFTKRGAEPMQTKSEG